MKKPRIVDSTPPIKAEVKSSPVLNIFKIIIILLFIVLIILLMIKYDFIGNILSRLNKETVKDSINDECSQIVGKLIHTIADEETCQMKCKNMCEVKLLAYKDSEFILKEGSCNSCTCFCTR